VFEQTAGIACFVMNFAQAAALRKSDDLSEVGLNTNPAMDHEVR